MTNLSDSGNYAIVLRLRKFVSPLPTPSVVHQEYYRLGLVHDRMAKWDRQFYEQPISALEAIPLAGSICSRWCG